jgi:hypothetical protein
MFGAPVRPSDSLGYVLGERLGNTLSGAIDRRAGPRRQRQADIERQQQVVAASGALDREKTAAEEQTIRNRLLNAQAANEEALPAYRKDALDASNAAKQQARLLSQLRVAGRYKRGENPALDKQLDDAGLAVGDFERGGKFQWHEAGGQVYTMDAGTGRVGYATVGDAGAPVEDASKKPNAEGLTPIQAKTVEEREADRASRERITNRLIASRERGLSASKSGVSRCRLRVKATGCPDDPAGPAAPPAIEPSRYRTRQDEDVGAQFYRTRQDVERSRGGKF